MNQFWRTLLRIVFCRECSTSLQQAQPWPGSASFSITVLHKGQRKQNNFMLAQVLATKIPTVQQMLYTQMICLFICHRKIMMKLAQNGLIVNYYKIVCYSAWTWQAITYLHIHTIFLMFALSSFCTKIIFGGWGLGRFIALLI